MDKAGTGDSLFFCTPEENIQPNVTQEILMNTD